MLVGGHGNVNPNSNYMKSRGLWLSYLIGILILHLILLSVPMLSIPMAWTLTNLIHNALHFVFLHLLKGTPWIPEDQGLSSRLTHWEQIDDGKQFTKTRKFLTAVPAVLFFLTCFYTKHEPVHFVVNYIATLLVIIPKLPQFHEVRLFGINK
ncbi:ORM1-like protein [Cimex lectularius]|uniref:ORM1-like protein n=1 Tax=Cimex lectularius TaxID=79782 RepID=A0A8I6TFQ9_CIMLE|nr:ORM1-like protein [Cimex lectularius]